MDDVEALLEPRRRAALPMAVQLRLYLDPFALFKDTRRGSAWVRAQALDYNRAMRWMLLTYLRRWAMLAAACFFCIVPLEAFSASRADVALPAAAFGVAFCVSVAISAYTLIAFFLLSAPPRR
jgi:hypothetical protein